MVRATQIADDCHAEVGEAGMTVISYEHIALFVIT
jgi:hypothetical protein